MLEHRVQRLRHLGRGGAPHALDQLGQLLVLAIDRRMPEQ